jgi:flagellar hook-basal body protein
MMASLFSGVSGLRNNLTKMNVIGNNIANVNTIGFKGGRVTFREALVQTYRSAGRPSTLSGGTNPIQLGLGMQVSSIDNIFQQGGLETTGQITDLAIQGSGFFVLSDGGGVYYTRAGAFGFDANSNLVDPSSGLFVQGRMADAMGNIPSDAVIGNIVMPFGQQDPAIATTAITLGNNLNSAATDSLATLQNAGDSGISYVSGYADDGAGGVHRLVITGNQATQSTQTFTNAATDALGAPIGSLTENMTLSSLNVTVFDDLELSIDNGNITARVTGLTGNSTIADLVSAINQVSGVSAELVGGEINLTRDRAGAGANNNVELSTSILNIPGPPNATTGNISGVIFGIPNGSQFTVNSGIDHTFVCRDYFTPLILSWMKRRAWRPVFPALVTAASRLIH